MIRGACLTNFRELMFELGADPDPVLRGAGIRPQDAGNHEVFLSYRSLILTLERAAEVTGRPDFGRRLALLQGIEILGPVGVAARTAPTTGDALQACSTYLSAYSPAIAVRLVPQDNGDRVFLEFEIVDHSVPPAMQVIELSLGVALRVVRYLRGEGYRPAAVHLPHAPLARQSDYSAYYGCEPCFNSPAAGLMLRESDLAKSVSQDAQAHEAIARYLDTIVDSDVQGMSGPVRQLVRQLLPTGAVGLEQIAGQFALHPKTLQRRLNVEGTSFTFLVEQCRQELAEHYLRDTDLSLIQVARELGYTEQSVLTRSCQRWYGRSPSALRRDLRDPERALGRLKTATV
ncbi:MAG: AraC family transcriptional regulator [Solirubrobacterales bacterium]|nr:AraC family transcriptional regulator [Solirubrobacterales bacterium]